MSQQVSTKTSPVVGTRHLVRLALRRDRIILPLWILLLAIMPASTQQVRTSRSIPLSPTALD
jgi:putative exporter of polyketide antibiotics